MDKKYLTSAQMAEKWGVSERSVRNYCNEGRVAGAVLIGKIWNIPEDAIKPERLNKKKSTNLFEQVRKKWTIEKRALLM